MIEQETEILTTESYQEYRELGGCFTPEDYQLVKDIISLEKVALPESPHTKEMEWISSNCSIQVTPQEKLIYYFLRTKMPPKGDSLASDTIAVYTMCDQFLMREIFLVTDDTGEKYKLFTERFPNIFN